MNKLNEWVKSKENIKYLKKQINGLDEKFAVIYPFKLNASGELLHSDLHIMKFSQNLIKFM